MFKKRVGILFSEFSERKDASLNSKNFILENLDKGKFDPLEIKMTEENLFSVGDELFELDDLSEKLDVVINCLCDKKHFNGKIQKMFELSGIEFVGSSAITSAISSDKELRKEILAKFEIKTPAFEVLEIDEDTDVKKESLRLFSSLPQPCVFKRGCHKEIFSDNVCENPKEIESVLSAIKSFGGGKVSVDEFLDGEDVTVSGIKDFIDGSAELYFTPCNTDTGEAVDTENGAQCTEVARKVFKDLGLSGHFSINLNNSKRGVYVLDINNFPELSEKSIFVNSLKDFGIDITEFLTHLIELEIQ